MRFPIPIPILLVVLFLGLFTAAAARASELSVPLSWGTESGKVALNDPGDFEGADPPQGPCAIGVDRTGNIVVADTWNKRIQIFSLSGRPLGSFGDASDPKFEFIQDVAFAPDGSIVFIEGASQQIVMLSKEGAFVRAFGARGEGAGQFVQAQKIGIASDRTIFVGDYGRSQMLIFSQDGKFLKEFPWNGNGFALDASDRLITLAYSEKEGYSVVATDRAGRAGVLFMIGHPELTRGQILGCDNEGNVAVSLEKFSGGESTVTRYRPDGQTIATTSLLLPDGNRMAVYTPAGRLFAFSYDPFTAPKSDIKVIIR